MGFVLILFLKYYIWLKTSINESKMQVPFFALFWDLMIFEKPLLVRNKLVFGHFLAPKNFGQFLDPIFHGKAYRFGVQKGYLLKILFDSPEGGGQFLTLFWTFLKIQLPALVWDFLFNIRLKCQFYRKTSKIDLKMIKNT